MSRALDKGVAKTNVYSAPRNVVHSRDMSRRANPAPVHDLHSAKDITRICQTYETDTPEANPGMHQMVRVNIN